MKITILGNGIYGRALAFCFTQKGHEVIFDVVDDSELIFICTTSNLVLSSLLKLQNDITNQKIVICSKGFAENGKFISEVLKENFKNEIFFLYGPTLADEIAKEVISGMVLAGGEGKEKIKKEIESDNLYIELSDDVVGVEVAGTLKNVMAIVIGMVEGAKYGQNTNALVFTKVMEEIKNIGLSLGAKPETFLGLSCAGDLFLSSRNRLFGIELGRGRKMDEIIKEIGHTPAGVFDIKNTSVLVEKLKVDAPFIKLLYKIVFDNYSLKEGIKEILKC